MGITKNRVTNEYSFLYKRLVTAKEKWKELYRPLQPALESFHKSKMNFKYGSPVFDALEPSYLRKDLERLQIKRALKSIYPQ
ncbi:unnamed protein product [Porites evermanni]|uniref:Uncharacterized protein n=1 Tax=Porites evermanni TaxID=104178 RepID=A0ABN8PPP7_9CNID|nr:unnamed protein product [Porites evermanni]